MKKKILLIPLALILIVSLIACAAPAPTPAPTTTVTGPATTATVTAPAPAPKPTYRWKLQHIRPTDTAIDLDVHWLVDKINQDSGGRIVIDIYPAGQLGDYSVVQRRVSAGDIEMQLACLGTEEDRRLMIGPMPWLAKNYDDIRTLFATGGFVDDMIAEFLLDQNIKKVSGWPCYFGGVALVKEAPSPTDPDVPKNIKIRVPKIKSFELVAENLGFIATPIAFAELYTSMQTGIVDGAIGAGAEGYYANIRDLIHYYLPNNDHVEYWYFYMNNDLWKSLSAEDQKILYDAGQELEKRRFARVEEDQATNEQKLADYGITVINFTDADLTKIAEKMYKNVWPELREVIGPEVVDAALAEIR